jgi:hypothetical protein
MKPIGAGAIFGRLTVIQHEPSEPDVLSRKATKERTTKPSPTGIDDDAGREYRRATAKSGPAVRRTPRPRHQRGTL